MHHTCPVRLFYAQMPLAWLRDGTRSNSLIFKAYPHEQNCIDSQNHIRNNVAYLSLLILSML